MNIKALMVMVMAGAACGLAFADEGPDAKRIAHGNAALPLHIRETQSGNFLAGQFAQRHQDWDTASQYIGRVLNYDPTNVELQKRAMILAMGSGETSRAIASARKIVQQQAGDGLALLFVTLDDFARQDYKAVISSLSAMPEGSIADFVRPILISWAKAGMGEHDIASIKSEDNPLYAYHAFLIADYLNKPPADIEAVADKLITLSAVDAYELQKIADILLRNGKTEKAKNFYTMILAQQPDNQPAQDKLAAIKAGSAVADAPQMQTAEEGAAEAMFDMGRILFREMSNDSAMVFTRMALHLNPSLTEGRLMLAHILNRSERYDEAIKVYLSIPAGSPYYKDARHSAADLLERDGHYEQAIGTLEKLYKESGDVGSIILIGDLERRAEKYVDAIATYDRAEKIVGGTFNDPYWHVLYARGMAHERQGNYEKAEADLLAALKFQPDHPYLLNYLGYSWADHGKNLDKAKQMIEKAVSLRPDDGYIADSLGWVLYREGDYHAALPHLEKAVELLPYDPTINDHLGDVYWQIGRMTEARFQWNRALNHAEDDETLSAGIREKIAAGMPLAPEKINGTQQAKADKDDAAIKR